MRTCAENGKCDCQSKKKQSVVIIIRKIRLKFDCPVKIGYIEILDACKSS